MLGQLLAGKRAPRCGAGARGHRAALGASVFKRVVADARAPCSRSRRACMRACMRACAHLSRRLCPLARGNAIVARVVSGRLSRCPAPAWGGAPTRARTGAVRPRDAFGRGVPALVAQAAIAWPVRAQIPQLLLENLRCVRTPRFGPRARLAQTRHQPGCLLAVRALRICAVDSDLGCRWSFPREGERATRSFAPARARSRTFCVRRLRADGLRC